MADGTLEIDVLVNIFQKNVFDINPGDVIKIKSLVDGREIERNIPTFGAIISIMSK